MARIEADWVPLGPLVLELQVPELGLEIEPLLAGRRLDKPDQASCRHCSVRQSKCRGRRRNRIGFQRGIGRTDHNHLDVGRSHLRYK